MSECDLLDAWPQLTLFHKHTFGLFCTAYLQLWSMQVIGIGFFKVEGSTFDVAKTYYIFLVPHWEVGICRWSCSIMTVLQGHLMHLLGIFELQDSQVFDFIRVIVRFGRKVDKLLSIESQSVMLYYPSKCCWINFLLSSCLIYEYMLQCQSLIVMSTQVSTITATIWQIFASEGATDLSLDIASSQDCH